MSIASKAAAARRGDRAAFADLVRAHGPAVHRVALTIVGEATVAEDVAQETFLAAWRGLRGLRDDGRFSGWLIGIARRRALDAARRSGRRVEVVAQDLDAGSVPWPPPERTDADVLWAAVDELDDGQKRVLKLYYGEGCSVAEVARRLGLREPTVRKRLSRGRERLREGVADELRTHRAVGGLAAAALPSTAKAALGLGAVSVVCVAMLSMAIGGTVDRVVSSLPVVPAPRTVVTQAPPSPTIESGPERSTLWIRVAILAAEDARFYEHHGVDSIATARALWSNVSGFGTRPQGASTLTQQLAKQMLAKREGSRLERKILEMLLAYRIESELDKAAILDRYLGAVYFGHGAWGIDEAAEAWFAKQPDALTLDEAAMLAALPAAPQATDPRHHPEAARARRAWVLDRMVAEGWVSQPEAERAKQAPLPSGHPRGETLSR